MQEFIIVAGIHILGVASPGPDLAVVLKNSFRGGRKIGTYTALGIALGILVHVFYSVVGLAVIISKSIVLFNTIKMIGALYLVWIGFQALRSKKSNSIQVDGRNEFEITPVDAIKQGLLTNVMNPKVTLFFLSLFTQVINPATANVTKIGYGLWMVFATFLWFTCMATVMTRSPIRRAYSKYKHYIDHLFGVALVALGTKIALSKN